MFSLRAAVAACCFTLILTACAAEKKAEAPAAPAKSTARLLVPEKKINAIYGCAHPEEIGGLNARALQTELMVGALTCKRGATYNNIVKKFKSPMRESSEDMKTYFNRAYGKQGVSRMDLFVTRLANEAATRSKRTSEYCEAVENLYYKTLTLSEQEYLAYASEPTFANATGVAECGTEAAALSASPKAASPAKRSSTKPAKAAKKK